MTFALLPFGTNRTHGDIDDGRTIDDSGDTDDSGDEVAVGPFGIDHVLSRARADIERVSPHEAALLQRDGGLIVDIRPESDRSADGRVPDALHLERIVLEWRLDPAGPHRIPDLRPDQPVILMCNEGYASSLAAAQVRELGLTRATDLVGGFRAWSAAGLPLAIG